MGRILTITGPSGAGKSRITKALLEEEGFSIITSITTRPKRPTDLEGEYLYLQPEKFDELEKRGSFLWVAKLRSCSYGTLKRSIDSALEMPQGIKIMILVPEILRILCDRLQGKNLISLFIKTSPKKIRERLMRAGLKEDEIKQRLNDQRNWEKEMKASGVPYHAVSNDGDLPETLQNVYLILATNPPTN